MQPRQSRRPRGDYSPRIRELERENELLLAAVEAAHANVRAALDPAIDGHLGLIVNAESILRSVAER